MPKNNYPNVALSELSEDFVGETVRSLKELNALGKPQTDREVQERIDKYFAFCERTSLRPGIESLCLSLHISRTTLFNWCHGIGCSHERQEIAEQAKFFIGAFMEQSVLRGKISPPSGIFILKNWLGYKDTISFVDATQQSTSNRPAQTAQQIAERHRAILDMPEPERPEL